MIQVVELCADLEPVYTDFLLSDRRNMIYGSLEFRSFLRRVVPGEPKYLVALRNSHIVGALPCFIATDSKLGGSINSLPWYGSHGGCLIAPDAPSTTRDALLVAYRELLDRPEMVFGTLILPLEEQAYLPKYIEVLKPHVTDSRIGQLTELPIDGPDLEQRLEITLLQKTRNAARKARKQGFELIITDDDWAWQFLYQTHVENMVGIGGRAKPWDHFVAMRNTIPAEWRQIMIAMRDGIAVAAMLLFRFNHTVEYITPVIKHEFRSLQPLSFLIWQGMLDAVKSGYRWWNWGGTWITQKSLHHFKAGWGAKDRPYTYLTHATQRGIEALKNDRALVAQAFPYYFTYPFHLL